ncbi:NAD-dependent dehydratase [Geodermatophilus sp. TF02-6]|uniref:NAD-dependent epimerase/dehydratase family protein n=1 Tax=Geodermatophilus sp. TF02-6 TaxID=2250575 RepID=UPI000DE80861|nr:NAD-dependent epimerase/dehydratase family protein [Geodermatophilus sp. TF02-6]RBY75309.1 NAD-dependent dehydratase [Geodermatophilus sp. TF02-6]
MARILVTGAGGFIGGALAAALAEEGHTLRCVDRKPVDEWYQVQPGAENVVADLQGIEACRAAVRGTEQVYNLAADMGGMGFIENNKALCMLSVLTSTHMLVAARDEGVERFFYSSSACVYAADKQTDVDVTALREEDAYPAMAEDGYGWEKLFTERMCRHFYEDFGLETRVARYHNVYGPHGTFEGGREKAPAALARKIAVAALTGEDVIEVWGDGEQTRSFMYIDDCVRGTRMIADGPYGSPVNLGSSELVSINQMVSVLEEIAGVRVRRRHDLSAPQGVRGRNSDNTLILERYGWEPTTSLRAGLESTYRWIHDQVAARQRPVVGAVR